MRPEKQLQYIQCGSSSFSLDISKFPSSLYVYDARPYHWSFLESHLDCWNTDLSCIIMSKEIFLLIISFRTTLPFVFCSLNPRFESFITIRSSSDYSCSRPRPNAQYMIWALDPTTYIQYDQITILLLVYSYFVYK